MSINPVYSEHERLKAYLELNKISFLKTTFYAKRSDEVWFDLKDRNWDLVLIDGCHGFPIPFMEWYFFIQKLKIGGYVIIDDIQLSTGKILNDFIRQEDAWKMMAVSNGKTLIFQKIKEFDYNKEWSQQP